ncbi:hypothetical protein [Mycobacterium sp. NAZ190054]|uniref:hypothetical protein n=1 Tax=Mycobacterium sp. NAZ190054 TaxID=1747766 RepID=UPI000795328F|nr:hypothetical protein [Mycobacterium sp. NAZ190054]KWX57234.1 hypothetical protein ASJ79_12090 [Mycobacterium sp. NAZ190054]
MGAAGVAGWLWTSAVAQPQQAPAQQQPPAAAQAPQEIHRVGQVIAASRDSLTTTTPDGQTTTFRITADTARIGEPGTLKSHVVVLGVVHDGVAVATAIADQGAVGPDGPPMDYDLPT